MTEHELRTALREGLSGGSFPQGRQERVLRQLRGEEKMKRKLSVGLALLLALALAAVTALAVTISRQYFADLAQLQFESGYYDDWGLKEKEAMVDIMAQYDLMDKDKAASLKAEGEAAIDEYMIDRYGINGRSDVIGLYAILDKELGAIDTWDTEQKAWYSQLLRDHGLLGRDEEIYLVPGEDVITPEEAVAIAKAAILAAENMPADGLDSYAVTWDYLTYADDVDGMVHYAVYFGQFDYSCSVSPQGKVLSNEDNEFFTSPEERRQQREADAEHMLHWSDQEVDDMLKAYAQEHGLGEEGYMFRTWSIADQYAATELIRPVIQRHMAEDPLYCNEVYIYLTTHFYGLPDEKSMPQEEAEAAAIAAAAQAAEVSENLLEVAFLHYDVTDPAHPIWKVTVRNNDAGRDAGFFGSYLVCADAYTRETTRVEKWFFGPGSTADPTEVQY